MPVCKLSYWETKSSQAPIFNITTPKSLAVVSSQLFFLDLLAVKTEYLQVTSLIPDLLTPASPRGENFDPDQMWAQDCVYLEI